MNVWQIVEQTLETFLNAFQWSVPPFLHLQHRYETGALAPFYYEVVLLLINESTSNQLILNLQDNLHESLNLKVLVISSKLFKNCFQRYVALAIKQKLMMAGLIDF